MIRFTCTNCGADTTLTDINTAPPNELCPPCHFLGLDWRDDPDYVEFVESLQRAHEAH